MITVEAITFNHDPGALTDDALNIRRNASQTVHVPEYDAAIGRRGSVSVDRRLGQGRRDR